MANPPRIEIEKDETASDGRHRDLQDNIEKKKIPMYNGGLQDFVTEKNRGGN